MKTLEFFYDFGSPYSYLASTQVEAVANRTGSKLLWRPFLLGAVFKASGNVAPSTNFYKARYLWKDLGDWAREYRLPPIVLPETFPARSLRANRLALVAGDLGKLPAFTHATFRAAFQEGKDVDEPAILRALLAACEIDVEPAWARIETDEIKMRLRANTDEAVSRGAFGAPTFFVDGEDMYVGNDRLRFVEAALVRKS